MKKSRRNYQTGAGKEAIKALGHLIGSFGGILISFGVFIEDLGNFVIALEGFKAYCVGITALVMLLLRVT